MTKKNTPSNLKISHKIRVRFNETDPIGIVWHGNYLKYFEEGREAFGRHYKISYLNLQDLGVISKASSVFKILNCSAIDIFLTGVRTTFSSVP